MLTAKEIVTDIANDKEYYALCKKLAPNIYDDLFQDLLLILLEYDPARLVELYTNKKIRFFVVKILMNQACSTRSDFYTTYRKRTDPTNIDWFDGHQEDEDLIPFTEKAIEEYSKSNENNWYRAELFKEYLKEGNIRSLSKKTDIPVMSIQRSLKEFKRDIKNLVNENTFNTSI